MSITSTPELTQIVCYSTALLIMIVFIIYTFSKAMKRPSLEDIKKDSFASKYSQVLEALRKCEAIEDVVECEKLATRLLTVEEINKPTNDREIEILNTSFKAFWEKHKGRVGSEPNLFAYARLQESLVERYREDAEYWNNLNPIL